MAGIDREKETDRQKGNGRDRQIDKIKDRQRGTQRYRKTDRQKDNSRDTQRETEKDSKISKTIFNYSFELRLGKNIKRGQR